MAALNLFTGVLIPLWALGHCFFGYVLFRVALALNGLAGGFVLGAYVLGAVRPTSSEADVWVAGIVGGVLLMLAAWFLYRVVFAGLTGWMLAAAIFPFIPPPVIVAWIVATVVGVLAAVLVFVYLRNLVAVVTSIAGAAVFVVVVIDQWFWMGAPMEWLGRDFMTLVALFAFLLLAAAGLAVQFRTRRRFGKRFGPPEPTRRHANNTTVRPKFTKV